jgi:hypothetical protein
MRYRILFQFVFPNNGLGKLLFDLGMARDGFRAFPVGVDVVVRASPKTPPPI